MLNSHPIAQIEKRLFFVFLVVAVISQACSPSVAPTPIPTAEPSSTVTAAPSVTPTPSASLTPTEPLTATPEPIPEFFAGFTQDAEVPFLLLHRSGETLGALSKGDGSDMIGAVWVSADQKSSLVVYSDSNGLPQQAVVGQDTLFFSNHSGATMDMTVVHADGSEEIIAVELDSALLDKISTIRAQSLILVSYSTNPPKADWLDEAQKLLFRLGAIGCLKKLKATTPTLNDLAKALATACAGTILEGAINYGERFSLNVKALEEIKLYVDMALCARLDLLSCLSAEVTLIQQIRDFADESNRGNPRWIQYGTFDPTKLQSPDSSLHGTVNVGQAFCRYGPGKAYLPLYDLFQGDKVKIDGRDFINFSLWVQPENQDGHCWAPKSVFEIVGDISTVPVVQPNLPRTPSAMPPTGVRAIRDGDMVTISWDAADYIPAADRRGYLLELFVCQNGFFVWLALNPEENSITIKDEEGCDPQSSGQVYVVNVRGYSDPTPILPWP